MKLKQYREQLGYTQKELADRSGINYRSLQDYEQGHKRLASANGETLLRLSMALGCSVEQLFDDPDDPVAGAPLHKENNVPLERITAQPLFSPDTRCRDAGSTTMAESARCFITMTGLSGSHSMRYLRRSGFCGRRMLRSFKWSP